MTAAVLRTGEAWQGAHRRWKVEGRLGRSGRTWLVSDADVEAGRADDQTVPRLRGVLRDLSPLSPQSRETVLDVLRINSPLMPLLLDRDPEPGPPTFLVSDFAPDDAFPDGDVDRPRSRSFALDRHLAEGRTWSPVDALRLLSPLASLLDLLAAMDIVPVEIGPDHLVTTSGRLAFVGLGRHGYRPDWRAAPPAESASASTVVLDGAVSGPSASDPLIISFDELRLRQRARLLTVAVWMVAGTAPPRAAGERSRWIEEHLPFLHAGEEHTLLQGSSCSALIGRLLEGAIRSAAARTRRLLVVDLSVEGMLGELQAQRAYVKAKVRTIDQHGAHLWLEGFVGKYDARCSRDEWVFGQLEKGVQYPFSIKGFGTDAKGDVTVQLLPAPPAMLESAARPSWVGNPEAARLDVIRRTGEDVEAMAVCDDTTDPTMESDLAASGWLIVTDPEAASARRWAERNGIPVDDIWSLLAGRVPVPLSGPRWQDEYESLLGDSKGGKALRRRLFPAAFYAHQCGLTSVEECSGELHDLGQLLETSPGTLAAVLAEMTAIAPTAPELRAVLKDTQHILTLAAPLLMSCPPSHVGRLFRELHAWRNEPGNDDAAKAGRLIRGVRAAVPFAAQLGRWDLLRVWHDEGGATSAAQLCAMAAAERHLQTLRPDVQHWLSTVTSETRQGELLSLTDDALLAACHCSPEQLDAFAACLAADSSPWLRTLTGDDVAALADETPTQAALLAIVAERRLGAAAVSALDGMCDPDSDRGPIIAALLAATRGHGRPGLEAAVADAATAAWWQTNGDLRCLCAGFDWDAANGLIAVANLDESSRRAFLTSVARYEPVPGAMALALTAARQHAIDFPGVLDVALLERMMFAVLALASSSDPQPLASRRVTFDRLGRLLSATPGAGHAAPALAGSLGSGVAATYDVWERVEVRSAAQQALILAERRLDARAPVAPPPAPAKPDRANAPGGTEARRATAAPAANAWRAALMPNDSNSTVPARVAGTPSRRAATPVAAATARQARAARRAWGGNPLAWGDAAGSRMRGLPRFVQWWTCAALLGVVLIPKGRSASVGIDWTGNLGVLFGLTMPSSRGQVGRVRTTHFSANPLSFWLQAPLPSSTLTFFILGALAVGLGALILHVRGLWQVALVAVVIFVGTPPMLALATRAVTVAVVPALVVLALYILATWGD